MFILIIFTLNLNWYRYVKYCNYRDPSKFVNKSFGGAGNQIPGESDRDRRLRLRALEKKARLNSAKSTSSAYSNTKPSSLPSVNSYQENVNFPENQAISQEYVKPAMEQDLSRFRNRFESHKFENHKFENQDVHQSSNPYNYDIGTDSKPLSVSSK